MAKPDIFRSGRNYGTTFGRISKNWDYSVFYSGRCSSSTASRSPFPRGKVFSCHHPYKHQFNCQTLGVAFLYILPSKCRKHTFRKKLFSGFWWFGMDLDTRYGGETKIVPEFM